MGEKYKPVKGDRVRVVYEGEAANIDDDGFTVADEVPVFFNDPGLVSVEKIESPIEVFKPGDRLREKTMGYEVTLANVGYLHHYRDGDVQYHRVPSYPSFTSKDYEKVSIG